MELTAAAGNWALPLTRTKTEAVGLRWLSSEQPVLRHDDHDPGGFDLVNWLMVRASSPCTARV